MQVQSKKRSACNSALPTWVGLAKYLTNVQHCSTFSPSSPPDQSLKVINKKHLIRWAHPCMRGPWHQANQARHCRVRSGQVRVVIRTDFKTIEIC